MDWGGMYTGNEVLGRGRMCGKERRSRKDGRFIAGQVQHQSLLILLYLSFELAHTPHPFPSTLPSPLHRSSRTLRRQDPLSFPSTPLPSSPRTTHPPSPPFLPSTNAPTPHLTPSTLFCGGIGSDLAFPLSSLALWNRHPLVPTKVSKGSLRCPFLHPKEDHEHHLVQGAQGEVQREPLIHPFMSSAGYEGVR